MRIMGIFLLIILVSGTACTRGSDTAMTDTTMTDVEQDREMKAAIATITTAHGNTGMLKSAEQRLSRVLQANPSHVQAHIEMARVHIKSGCTPDKCFNLALVRKAENELSTALRIDPGSADALILRGALRQYQWHYDESIEALEQAEKIGTDNPRLYIYFAETYKKMDKLDLMASSLKKLELQILAGKKISPDIEEQMRLLLIYVYSKQKKYDDVEQQYRNLIALDPDNAFAHGDLAGLLLWKNGDIENSIAESSKALELKEYPLAHYVLGQAQYAKWAQLRRNDPAQAEMYFKRASKNLPSTGFAIASGACYISNNIVLQTMIEALLERGASIDERGAEGYNALSYATNSNCGDLGSVKWLLAHGASVNVIQRQGWSPLAAAVSSRYLEIAMLLLEKGADIEATPEKGKTPLMIAVMNSDVVMVRKLIAHKAKVDVVNSDGFTPLMFSALYGSDEIASLLLQAGADVSLKELSTRRTAAEIADYYHHKNVGDLIRAHTAAQQGR